MSRARLDHLLRDHQRHCEYLVEDTDGLTFDDYLERRTIRHAVERNLITLGVIAYQLRALDDDMFDSITELRSTIGLRNRLAHGYDDDLNDELIWETITVSIPKLLTQIEELI